MPAKIPENIIHPAIIEWDRKRKETPVYEIPIENPYDPRYDSDSEIKKDRDETPRGVIKISLMGIPRVYEI